jgi:LacI family transcriptional regulator
MAHTSPSGRPATIQDVADHAGVSMATVSRVLSGNYPVAPATRAKVHKAVADLDYVANAHARALAGTASKLVAILVSDLTAPFYSAVAYGVEQQAVAEDRLCMVATTGADPEREVAMVEALRRQSADAVVLIGGVVDTPEYQDRMSRLAGLLDSAGSRLVLCGRPSPGTKLPVTVVEYDNEGGAFAVTSHLLSLGHRRILFLGGLEGNTTTVGRLAGFRKALAAFGVAETVAPVIGSMGRLFGYDAMTGILEERAGGDLGFTAVVAAEDLVAGGAMSAMREAGLRVPDDVSVTGFNDDYMAPDLVASLTTVHIPAEELGRAAVRLALHRDDTPPPNQHMKLGTHIVVRDSVRPLIGG